MKVITTIGEFKEVRKQTTGSVGFVPTMGYLHEGHLTLVRWAKSDNGLVAVSIFVNPAQFGPSEDFAAYPRDTERDLSMLKQEKVDWVFMPSTQELYPSRFNSWVEVKGVTEPLEGASRPGHFRGVATIVAKLFNIVEPHKAYFGQKDAQQVVVIQKMARDLNMNLEVVVVPTVRESNGLAMSSRNVYLTPGQRQAASVLWHSLQLAQQLWTQGERSAESLRQKMIALIQRESLAKIDYVSVADPETLEELGKIEGHALISLAVYFGKTRLIDNILLEGKGS